MNKENVRPCLRWMPMPCLLVCAFCLGPVYILIGAGVGIFSGYNDWCDDLLELWARKGE